MVHDAENLVAVVLQHLRVDLERLREPRTNLAAQAVFVGEQAGPAAIKSRRDERRLQLKSLIALDDRAGQHGILQIERAVGRVSVERLLFVSRRHLSPDLVGDLLGHPPKFADDLTELDRVGDRVDDRILFSVRRRVDDTATCEHAHNRFVVGLRRYKLAGLSLVNVADRRVDGFHASIELDRAANRVQRVLHLPVTDEVGVFGIKERTPFDVGERGFDAWRTTRIGHPAAKLDVAGERVETRLLSVADVLLDLSVEHPLEVELGPGRQRLVVLDRFADRGARFAAVDAIDVHVLCRVALLRLPPRLLVLVPGSQRRHLELVDSLKPGFGDRRFQHVAVAGAGRVLGLGESDRRPRLNVVDLRVVLLVLVDPLLGRRVGRRAGEDIGVGRGACLLAHLIRSRRPCVHETRADLLGVGFAERRTHAAGVLIHHALHPLVHRNAWRWLHLAVEHFLNPCRGLEPRGVGTVSCVQPFGLGVDTILLDPLTLGVHGQRMNDRTSRRERRVELGRDTGRTIVRSNRDQSRRVERLGNAHLRDRHGLTTRDSPCRDARRVDLAH